MPEETTYKFSLNKKIIFYLTSLFLGAMILVLVEKFSLQPVDDFVANIFKDIVYFIIFANFFFVSYQIMEDCLIERRLLGRTVKFENITKISIPQKHIYIEYMDADLKKRMRIRTYILENDMEKARSFLSTIVQNVPESAEIDEKISRFVSGENKELLDHDYKKIGGSLYLLAALLLLYVGIDLIASAGWIWSLSDGITIIYMPAGCISVLEFLWGLVALIMVLLKKAKAVAAVVSFRIFYIFSALANSVLAVFMELEKSGSLSWQVAADIGMDVITALFISLAVLEFMKTSKRVKMTLIK